MSRPNISYPTPIAAPSFDSPMSSRSGGLDASPMPRGDKPRQTSGAIGSAGTLDTRITRLLVTTKQLLQGLDSWARGELDEEGVSDVYVKLGNGFEICVAAFQKAGIDTRELDPIPQDLRECLEEALSAEQSQGTLNRYLPQIREIIFNLLNGLKQKQAAYKRLLAERQPETPPPVEQLYARPPRSESSASGDPRLSARSGASSHSQASSASVSPRPIVSQLPPKVPSSMALAERPQRAGLPARPAPPDAFRPPRMRVPDGSKRSVSPSPQPEAEAPQLVRHQLVDNPVPIAPSPSNGPSSLPKAPPRPDRYSRDRDSFGNPRLVSRFSADSEVINGSPIRSPVSHSPPQSLQALSEAPEIPTAPPAPPSPPAPTAAPALPTLNFPSSSLDFGDDVESRSGGTHINSLAEVPAETRATLAALGRADGLERRASKRFSSYTFSKMLPTSPNHSKSASAGSPQRPMRRVDRPPPMPALPESLASSNLAVTADDTHSRASSSPASTRHSQLNGDTLLLPTTDPSASPSSTHTDDSFKDASEGGSVRIVKTPDPEEPLQQNTPRPHDANGAGSASPNGPTSISVFLQIGPQVKKASLDLPLSLSALRLMFMERFEYDPGMDDFPDVYMRDPRTGVQYELEDMEDLREGCILNLNIEVLDQVKQHIDHTFATIMQELKEVKSSIDHSRRISMSPAASLLTVSPSYSKRLPIIKTPDAPSRPSSPRPDRSVSSTVQPIVQADLRAHQEEVQNLRRDLAIMRQVHVDFLSETKNQFSHLKEQSGSMRHMITTKSGGSRALLDVSKTKIEELCQETIQAVDDISDMIDAAREDAHKRFVIPSKSQMAKINADLAKASELVDRFTREVTAVEPTWRATWHFELSRVMEEQKLLPYQTKLTTDLKNDIKDATEMLSVVQDFVHQRQTGLGRTGSRGFRTPEPDVTPVIPNLLMEIRTKESTDPTQRLRAIEAQQKAREKEKLNKTDDFTEELTGFVGQKKLKKTGGTEEAERMRQRRHDVTVRRMLSGSGEDAGGGLLSPQVTGASMTTSGTASPTVLGPALSGRTSRSENKGG
ncbi:actin interacting protein 3-domain-containing protein [Naematelia encephala]|uniref:Actin interacting protein 3-domain-containing protein n=1 Tax=Naematelia encephala TaxID=71784 RepID=A0A1Y2BBR9_9TREE|nr:actin interacting protein 3-domain-containing protein [Naematelia encephala]